MNTIQFFEPKRRVLDFSECKYWGKMHQIVRKELELPEWYGKNLDALWDSITGIRYVPADVTIRFIPKTKVDPRPVAHINKIVDVFKDAQKEYNEITLTVEM